MTPPFIFQNLILNVSAIIFYKIPGEKINEIRNLPAKLKGPCYSLLHNEMKIITSCLHSAHFLQIHRADSVAGGKTGDREEGGKNGRRKREEREKGGRKMKSKEKRKKVEGEENKGGWLCECNNIQQVFDVQP